MRMWSRHLNPRKQAQNIPLRNWRRQHKKWNKISSPQNSVRGVLRLPRRTPHHPPHQHQWKLIGWQWRRTFSSPQTLSLLCQMVGSLPQSLLQRIHLPGRAGLICVRERSLH
ncbi:hypothetical protein HOLleu_04594 [Holothuria leucospilota]|uniref:Uncharacterized protein n=1 Tax=Holothuria leucospilota TaxID=206669 RepID=A0A9Q1CTH5_HOLLE|nr:hypothetical protein HOLleu_04594 [Holothuria leucospilota]